MGWNYIKLKKANPLISSNEKQRFYFVHSYHVVCNNSDDILATCDYGKEFHCMLNHDNIYGVQFHPEKSLSFGMELLYNFSKI